MSCIRVTFLNQISPKPRVQNPFIRQKRKNGSCSSPCQLKSMMVSISKLENKMAKIVQRNSRYIQIVGPKQLIQGDKINLGACRGGCIRLFFTFGRSGIDLTFGCFSKPYYSSHSTAKKKMNFAKHYEGFCYPSNTVSLQVQFGSNVSPSPHGCTSLKCFQVLEIPGVITTECQCGFGHHCNLQTGDYPVFLGDF